MSIFSPEECPNREHPFPEQCKLCGFDSTAPTDNEREALWDAFDEMHQVTEGGCDTRGDDVADMVLRLGFHRTVTPTDDEREAMQSAVEAGLDAYAKNADNPEYGADPVTSIADHVLAAGFHRTVQGESSDAAVLAAAREYHERGNGEGSFDRASGHVRTSLIFRMRAALRAAAATEGGDQ